MNWRERAARLRTLPLPVVLARLAAIPDPRDPAKWHTARGILSITGAKFMNWSQDRGGGGAIDLVMHLQQIGFGQALQWLAERFDAPLRAPLASSSTLRVLSLPPPAMHQWPQVERYLIDERKLPRALLAPLIQSAIIYSDDWANAVFVLLDPNATPIGAELRGTTPTAWRGMAAGSRKNHGFFSIASTLCHAIVLCESAIDAISCHALHPAFRCLSTSGARPDPHWLSSLLQQPLPIFCAFDADPTGDAMAQRMIQLHPSIGRLRPPAKDWNDCLRRHRS